MRVIDHALPGIGPHVRHIQVRSAVAIVIKPRSTHPWTNVFYASLARKVPKLASAVLIQILAPEIIRHVQIGPTVVVIVAPGRRETKPVVVLHHAGRCGAIAKNSAAVLPQLIAKEKVRRTVPRVMIRRSVRILRLALKVNVTAEIQVQLAVPIEISSGHPGKPAFGQRLKLESVRS